jgi:uncharacterized OB-fold protein
MSFDAQPDPDRVFLDALSDGRLVFQSCLGCGANWVTPTDICPSCADTRYCWQPAQGTGLLERAILLGEPDSFGDDPEITRAIGAVRLSEGPMVSVRIVGPVPSLGAPIRIKVLGGSLIAQCASTLSTQPG